MGHTFCLGEDRFAGRDLGFVHPCCIHRRPFQLLLFVWGGTVVCCVPCGGGRWSTELLDLDSVWGRGVVYSFQSFLEIWNSSNAWCATFPRRAIELKFNLSFCPFSIINFSKRFRNSFIMVNNNAFNNRHNIIRTDLHSRIHEKISW